MKRFGLGYTLMVLVVLALVSLACGTITTSLGEDDAASSEHGNAPASCESPAEPIGPIQDSSRHIDDAVDEDYPANCSYYCTEVQPDADSLKVDIDNFDADLDLFIGLGAISSVMGAEADENPWKSNDTDTSSESVTVSSPEAGIYYIEICSYDGSPSDYDLSVSIP